jgi:hypothetical protein
MPTLQQQKHQCHGISTTMPMPIPATKSKTHAAATKQKQPCCANKSKNNHAVGNNYLNIAAATKTKNNDNAVATT